MNIGIYDSGIGGISVLHQAQETLPYENYIYYADVDHVPYGTKSKEQVTEYADEVIQFMIKHDCKAVVIACNTATSAAAAAMRHKYDIPIIGIEPAVKPAVQNNDGKRIMVIATPLTVKEKKLHDLVARVDDTHLVDLVPLPKLVKFAENDEFETEEIYQYIKEELSEYDLKQYGEVVLGCTHFNYFKDSILRVFDGNISFIDGNTGTANQLKRVLEQKNLLSDLNDTGNVEYYLSGRKVEDTQTLERIAKLHLRLEKMKTI